MTTTQTTFRKGRTYTAAQVNAGTPGVVPVGHSYRCLGRMNGFVAFQRVGSNDVYYA